MEPENITPESLPGDAQLTPSDDKGAVGNVVAETTVPSDSLSLAEINKALGKDFKSKDLALKSFKDTFSYVGKKVDDVKKEVEAEIANADKTDALARELEDMRKERFFDKNPQYAEPSVRKLIERIGGNPQDVVNSEEFKTVFNKAADYDKSQSLKTVLESNPRLASSKDAFSKAKEMPAGEARETRYRTGGS